MVMLVMITSMVQGDSDAAASAVAATGNSLEQLRAIFMNPEDEPVTSSYLEQLSEPCRNHTILYNSKVYSEMWAMKMQDATAKYPEGLLYGSLIHLGNFDECISVRDVSSDSGVFHGQHCLATITAKQTGPSTRGMAVMLLAAKPLKLGVCIPSSCSPNDTATIARNLYQNLLAMSPLLTLEVNEMECHTTAESDLRAQDWVAIVILFIFGVLVVASTCYDIMTKNNESRRNLFLAFSWYTNGKKLLSTSNSADTLHCLHGIRFLSMAWVVYGHCYMHGASMAPANNLMSFAEEFAPGWKGIFVANADLAVDTFFLLSGLLVSYVFFRQVIKTDSFNIPLYYIHRYIRLTPAVAISIMLVVTLWKYTGSGPLWDTAAEEYVSRCEDYWWTNLLYVQNYVHPMTQCLSQGWYLAVDMQLYWLSPLVLIPLWKRPKIGWIVTAALMLAGLITDFVISYVFNLSGSHLESLRGEHQEEYQRYLYIPVYARFMPYLIGICLGYLLVDIKTKGRNIQISKWVALLLWLAGLGLMLFTLLIVYDFQQPDYEYEPVASAFYNSLGRPGWALGVSTIILLCATGHGGFTNMLLSWECFQVLSRLCYSTYLVHMSIQQTQYGSMRTNMYLGNMTLFPRFLSDLMIALMIAVPMSLVFESPFIVLEKELLGGKQQPSRKPIATMSSPANDMDNPSPSQIKNGEGMA